MNESKLFDPEIGDVYVLLRFADDYEEHADDTSIPGLLQRIWQAIRNKQPPRFVQLEYRCVLDVSPTTVFYITATEYGMRAAWKAEWMDWQSDAHLVANAGAALPDDQLQAITGSRKLPFDLGAMFGVDKSN